MNLQPLYDVKERLEYAAIAGVSLLGEDFRLRRAAEGLKPLAAASPVFARIDRELDGLLSAPAREQGGRLLDLLALVDAVAYTQARTGIEGELEPLPTGGGRYYQISYGQIQPLLTALTTTGGGRVEVVRSAWERCADYFLDYRVLPAVVAGLGDSYGEMAELCAALLKKLGAPVVPTLKQGFDPAGKREMARRVEVLAAVEGAEAAPWLREVLPQAKKDVRAAVLLALGGDPANTDLLLELAKAERGKNRDAVLEALAGQDGTEVRDFWEEELAKNSESVRFLGDSRADWASELVAAGLRERLEGLLARKEALSNPEVIALRQWFSAVRGKSSPAMLDFWRWTDGRLADIDRLRGEKERRLGFGRELAGLLLDSLCAAGPGPLCALCLELWEDRPKEPRWLPHAVAASLLTRSAAEVYDAFSPYVPTVRPLLGGEQKQALHNAVLAGLSQGRWNGGTDRYEVGAGWPAPQPLDPRWIRRLTHAAWKTTIHDFKMPSPMGYGEHLDEYDLILMRSFDRTAPEVRQEFIPYLRQRMRETGSWYSYGQYLLKVGGSPRGVLGESMRKNPKNGHLVSVWGLMSEAAKVLPGDEVAALLEEVRSSNGIYQAVQDKMGRAIAWTVEQLQAGKPFPELNDWMKL